MDSESYTELEVDEEEIQRLFEKKGKHTIIINQIERLENEIIGVDERYRQIERDWEKAVRAKHLARSRCEIMLEKRKSKIRVLKADLGRLFRVVKKDYIANLIKKRLRKFTIHRTETRKAHGRSRAGTSL